MTSQDQNGEIDYYNNDDPFNTYIDVDFLKNDIMDEDVETGSMSNSDLFRYYLEGELVKETENNGGDESILSSAIGDVQDDFTLAANPSLSAEDYSKYNLSITPITPITSAPDVNDLQQQNLNNAAVGPSLAVLNAQLAELLAKLPLIKQEPTENKVNIASTQKTEQSLKSSIVSTKNFAMDSIGKLSGDDDISVDLKKMSSKERRQLRNKISARNFRVRRKEYIQNLESTNQDQQKEINVLKQALSVLRDENLKLTQEVEQLRKTHTTPPSPPPTSTSTVPSKDTKNIHNRYLIPNVNKDAPATASNNQAKWQDARVRVQTAFIPELNFDKHMFEKKALYTDNLSYQTPGVGYDKDIMNVFDPETLQQGVFVFAVICTLVQRMTTMFTEAVCAIPPSDMAALLFPELAVNKVPEPEIVIEDEGSADEEPNNAVVSSDSNCEISQSVIDNITEASVLDWLYESMITGVIEQSQFEARLMELNSDWVSDEWDDTVLPHLF